VVAAADHEEKKDLPSAEQCIFDALVYRKKPTAEAVGFLE